MAKARGLGKGLASLIPTAEVEPIEMSKAPASEATPPAEKTALAVLDDLFPNRYQPRREIPEESLESLAESIREHGVIQPVLVRKIDDRYEIIAGERRWRAAKLAGVGMIPIRELHVDESQAMELALVENVQREDLNAMDVALGIQELIERFSLTHDEAAKKLGWSRAAITNKLRLLQLPEDILKLMSGSMLTEGHARALLSLPSQEAMSEVGKNVASRGLNVRQTEEMVRDYVPVHQPPRVKERTIYVLPRDVEALCKEKKISVKVANDRNGLALSIKGLHKWQIQVLLEYIGKSREELFPEE